MFNKIVNPKTGKKVLITGRIGKSILKKYINILIGGDDGCAINLNTNRCSKKGTTTPHLCEKGRACKRKKYCGKGAKIGRTGRLSTRCSKRGNLTPHLCEFGPINNRGRQYCRKKRNPGPPALGPVIIPPVPAPAPVPVPAPVPAPAPAPAPGPAAPGPAALALAQAIIASKTTGATKTGPHIVPLGAKCYDLLMYKDVDLREYLKKNLNNFVIKIENKYVGQNIDNLKLEYKHTITQPHLIQKGSKKYQEFFECKTINPFASGYSQHSGNVIFSKTYIKMSVPKGNPTSIERALIEKPNWLWEGPIPVGERIFKLVKGLNINSAVNNKVYHTNFLQIGFVVGIDHCNQHSSPLKTYKIHPTQMTLAQPWAFQ